MDLLCVGLAVCDIIAEPVDADVFQKDTVILNHLAYMPGGDAFNVASCAARSGLSVALISCIGADPSGKMLHDSAKERGIDTRYMCIAEGEATATSVVLKDSLGERHFAYNPGANCCLCIENIPDSAIRSARHLHLGSAMLLDGLDGDGTAELFEKAHSYHVTTSMDVTFDPEGLWKEKIHKALFHTDFFLPSLEEAQKITGGETPEEIAELLSEYPLQVLVIKLGSRGCFVKTKTESFYLPPLTRGQIVDTTGAGDCFVSVFLSSMLKGFSPRQGAKYASAGAGCCISQLGADCGFQNFGELERLVKIGE